MDQLSRILFHMDLMDAYKLLSCFRFDLHLSIPANGKVKLGDLIILWIIRIKIIFPVKFAVPCNVTVCGKSHCHRIFQNLLI